MKELYETWKSIKQHSAADMMLYCLLRATKAKSNDKHSVLANLIYKSFTPTSNSRKLAAGQQPWAGVYTAISIVAVYDTESPLYDCLETAEERSTYRQLLLSLLRRKIKLTDKSYACFLVRQDVPTGDLVMQAAHAAMLLGQTIAARWALPTATNGMRFLMFGAQDEPSFQRRLGEINRKVSYVQVARPVRLVDTTVQIVTLCTMPIRASLIRRRRLFEGCERLTLAQ